MTVRRPSPAATPENTRPNRALHYIVLAAIVAALVIALVIVLG